ncbi:MAG: DnaJ family domain-containing protein [Anaerolineales bacterium]
MSFDRIVEAISKEAMERGEFDNLPGKGKPIDLTEYFETPEEVRVAHSVLKNAGMTSREVELLREIAELKQILAAMLDEKKMWRGAPWRQKRSQQNEKQIQQKQIEFNLMMERQKKESRSKK